MTPQIEERRSVLSQKNLNIAYQRKWYVVVHSPRLDFADRTERTFPVNQAKLRLSRVSLQCTRYFDYLEKTHLTPRNTSRLFIRLLNSITHDTNESKLS